MVMDVRWSAELGHINDEIQEYVSTKGEDIPNELTHLLSNLDWVVDNIAGEAVDIPLRRNNIVELAIGVAQTSKGQYSNPSQFIQLCRSIENYISGDSDSKESSNDKSG